MKTYLINIPSETDIIFAGEIRAASWTEAQRACDANGYQLLGEFVGSVDCPEISEAMIQRHYGSLN